jgi:LuxR family glucitol operon transcriptional activator
MGGIGKSALALELAYRLINNYNVLPQDERFDVIIWTSASTSILTSDGIVPRKTADDDLEDVVNEIIQTFNQPSLKKESKAIRYELVFNLLRSKKTLLILDNFETYKDKEIFSFLRDLPSSTKTLITSRQLIDLGRQFRLSGLNKSESTELIKNKCVERDIHFSNEDVNRIFNLASGIPLVIEWITGLLSFGYTLNSLEKSIINTHSDIYKFILKESVSLLSDSAKKLLVVLSVCKSPIDRELLGVLSGYQNDELARDKAIVELEKLSLVNENQGLFSVLPLIRLYVQEELDPNKNIERMVLEQQVNLRADK